MPLLELQPDAVAHVYAKSIFQMAKDAGGPAMVQQVLDELKAVVDLGRADRQFGEFLGSRIIPEKDKHAVLKKVFEGKLAPLSLHFLMVLNDKGRLPRITSMVGALDELVQEEFGRVEVDVQTAVALGADQAGALRDRLSRALGREVIMHSKVDPSIIGGVRLQLGDTLIDASVSTQLRRVRDQFEQSGLPKVRAIAGKLA